MNGLEIPSQWNENALQLLMNAIVSQSLRKTLIWLFGECFIFINGSLAREKLVSTFCTILPRNIWHSFKHQTMNLIRSIRLNGGIVYVHLICWEKGREIYDKHMFMIPNWVSLHNKRTTKSSDRSNILRTNCVLTDKAHCYVRYYSIVQINFDYKRIILNAMNHKTKWYMLVAVIL